MLLAVVTVVVATPLLSKVRRSMVLPFTSSTVLLPAVILKVYALPWAWLREAESVRISPAMVLVSFRLPSLRMLVTVRVGGVVMVPSPFFTAGVKVKLLEVPPVM